MPRPSPKTRVPTRFPEPAPACRHFGTCGACDRLDQPIAEQLREKTAAVEHLLHPFLGGLRVEYEVPQSTPMHARARLLYAARPDRNGRLTLGHFAFHTHDVVRIAECRTQDEGLTALGVATEKILREMRIEAYDPNSGKGSVRAFQARLSPGTGELLMTVVTSSGLFPARPEIAERLLRAANDLPPHGRPHMHAVGVVRSISERDDEFLLGDRYVALKGRDHQFDRAGGLTFRVSAGSFYQIHREADAQLYRPALRLAGAVRGLRVVDGYGGVGTFGLRCAKASAANVEIVEDNPTACRDAEHNAARNELAQVLVVRAKFTAAEFAPGPDLLLVDPPRSGLGAEGVRRVLAARPKRVLHVACSAESLAADLEGLLAGGQRVKAMRLCDLFPHTGHVELVTLLE